MNCGPGDLAYIVVPPGFHRTLAGKFVTVAEHGPDDFHPNKTPKPGGRVVWHCTFHVPFEFEGRMIRGCYLLDSWLRPIRDPGKDAQDETLAWKPVPTTEEVTA